MTISALHTAIVNNTAAQCRSSAYQYAQNPSVTTSNPYQLRRSFINPTPHANPALMAPFGDGDVFTSQASIRNALEGRRKPEGLACKLLNALGMPENKGTR